MGNRRGRGNSRAWGIGGVVVVGALVVGLSTAALTSTSEPPTAAGTVPQLPASTATTEPEPLRAVYLGDSYTQGAFSSGPAATFPSIVSAQQAWVTVNLGRGGTGYRATSGQQGCGLDYCPTYEEMIPEAVAADPDVLIVSGGRNDKVVDADFRDRVESFYTTLREAAPDARIVVTSPLGDDDPTPVWIEDMGDVIRTEAERVGATYLELGQPLEGHPELIGADGGHPNDAGYRVIADRIDELIPTA